MDVHLSNELEELVQNKVLNSGYKSPGDVVREALLLMEERDQLVMLRKDEIRRQIAAGVESLRRGEGIDGDAVFDEIEAEIDAMEKQ